MGRRRTLRIAGRATRTLEDGPAALDDATLRLQARWEPAEAAGTRRRGAVDRPRAGLRHDDPLDAAGRLRLMPLALLLPGQPGAHGGSRGGRSSSGLALA